MRTKSTQAKFKISNIVFWRHTFWGTFIPLCEDLTQWINAGGNLNERLRRDTDPAFDMFSSSNMEDVHHHHHPASPPKKTKVYPISRQFHILKRNNWSVITCLVDDHRQHPLVRGYPHESSISVKRIHHRHRHQLMSAASSFVSVPVAQSSDFTNVTWSLWKVLIVCITLDKLWPGELLILKFV